MKKLKSTIVSNMPIDVYEAYKKDFQNGIVTVGNVCSADCFFCSQRWSPPNVIKNYEKFLTIKEIEHFTDLYLDKVRWIAAGIHTNSGEFFLHPDATKILSLLADKKKTSYGTVGIFSNGLNLTEEHVKLIKRLRLVLYLSLNSSDVDTRKKVMGSSYLKNKNAIDLINLLDKHAIHYVVHIVPLNQTLKSGDFEDTIRCLEAHKVSSILLHRPGYTKYTPSHIADDLTISDKELNTYILQMRRRYKVNIFFTGINAQEKATKAIGSLVNLFKDNNYLHKKKILFLYPENMKKIIPNILQLTKLNEYRSKLVKSKVFGGNVDCAGLLLVEDYITAINEFFKQEKDKNIEVIVLPRISFDINMEDLSMIPAKAIEKEFKTKLLFV